MNLGNRKIIESSIEKINTIVDSIYRQQVEFSKKGVYNCDSRESFLAKFEKDNQQSYRFYATHLLNRKVTHIPYSSLYENELSQITKHLLDLCKQVESLTSIKNVLSKTMSSNDRISYEEWRLKNPLIGSSYIRNFGPIESMSDGLFGTKKYFSSLLFRISDKHNTLIKKIIDLSSSFAKHLPVTGAIIAANSPKIYIGEKVSRAGEISEIFPVGWSRPENTRLVSIHGSIKQIYTNNLHKKIEQIYVPIARIFGFEHTIEFIKKNYVVMVLLHELCHTIGKFPGYKERLGDMYDVFEEIRTDFLSYSLADYLVKKGVLDKGFVERMIEVNMVVGLHMSYLWQYKKQRKAYACVFYHLLATCSNCFDPKVAFDIGSVKKLPSCDIVLKESENLLRKAKTSRSDDIKNITNEDFGVFHQQVGALLKKMENSNIPFSVN